MEKARIKRKRNIFTTLLEHSVRNMQRKRKQTGLPRRPQGRFRRQFLTSTSADVTFTVQAPLLFPSQTRKYRPRTFWYPYFWLWWPAGSERLEHREGGEISSTSHTIMTGGYRGKTGNTCFTSHGLQWDIDIHFYRRVYTSHYKPYYQRTQNEGSHQLQHRAMMLEN